MFPRTLCLVSAAALVAVLFRADAADPKPPAVPDAVYPKIVEQSNEIISRRPQGRRSPARAARAATTAVMLAAFAQQNLAGDDGAKRAAVRDAALEIAARVRAKEYAEALKQLDGLAALKADPKAKKEALPLEGKVTYKELMVLFRPPNAGGLGIEDRFDALGRLPDELAKGDLNDALLLDAYRSGVAAQIMREQKPKAGDPKSWQKFSDQMRQQSLDVAAAVQAGDGKKGLLAISALNRTCDKCHQEFRKDD